MAVFQNLIIKRSLYVPIFFAVLILGCSDNSIYDNTFKISEGGWAVNENISFEVNVEDTLASNNFFIHIRHADGYPYSNMYLFITTHMPNGKEAVDTLECILADESGRWLGKGIGDIYDCLIPFKKNVRFPNSGTYQFNIQQAMRDDRLPLVMDVGMRIEKNAQ